ncbi:Glycoprotein endo-alpha-1,2-mannosidase-like protein [Collichthys lucidus]|uniref:Glycoprotein endo-alpha-1,2-mannosidase-like protein n=1 Tax=Collichthys lucidus TaxID=240159 RepID=A0A4U5V4C5_COLLU|nr:Glycoprotein endo-alpha-1,2-mannosidase-like protein [Collichthys lucidus]
MARIRRKACIALFLFTLFIFGAMMGLRTLKPSDGFSDLAPGLEILPMIGGKMDRRSVSLDATASPGHARPAGSNPKAVLSNSGPEGTIFYDVQIFYYTWYGNPHMDGKYIHWDHILVPHWDPKIASSYPRGRHMPPEDIGSSFYPELNPYSSRDPDVLESHMEQIGASAAGTVQGCNGGTLELLERDGGVLVLSWYPPGLADDNGEPAEDLVPAVLDAAYRHNLKDLTPDVCSFSELSSIRAKPGQKAAAAAGSVAFHIQPYRGRNDQSVHDNIKYIIDRYGDHGAFYKFTSSTGKSLPLFYIYDSYLTPPESWSEFLTPSGSHSVRGSAYDSVFIALIVDERHRHDILAGGFDGMYTYFASNGFSFGSSHQNWKAIKAFCDRQQPPLHPQRRPWLHRHKHPAVEQPQHAQQGERPLL